MIAGLLIVALAATTGCASRRDPTIAPTIKVAADSKLEVESNIEYREVGDNALALDACLPAATQEPSASVILLHGGGFTQGARTDESISNMCVWFAEHGYAAFPVSYRLAPDSIYPSQPQDVQAAVEWLRQPAQTERFHIDPARIGALGSSAGAILALQVATAGDGPTDTGSRIGAVISLSGVADMTASAATLGSPSPEAVSIILNYLGCTSILTCDGTDASPITHVDASDPPALLVGSSHDLVPIEQARALASALDAVDVPNEVVEVEGDGHGAQLMNQDVRDAILTFLSAEL